MFNNKVMKGEEKNIIKRYDFILSNYSVSDISRIRQDWQLRHQGYHFLYIIDPYDIVENYLPYTEVELFAGISIHSQVHKFICYDYFFGGLNYTKTILFDEYKIELLAAKNKVTKHLREVKNVFSNIERLRKETGNFHLSSEKTISFFYENMELILLLLILESKKSNILEEFLEFLRTRLFISKSDELDGQIEPDIAEIIAKCKPGPQSTHVFDKFVDENIIRILSTDKIEERQVFLENTFRDIQVMDRVSQINSSFSRDNKKYFAIYLSSARKTKDLFKGFKSQMPLEFSDSNLSRFHRNIFQYFLFDRICLEYGDNEMEGFLALDCLEDILSSAKERQDRASDFERLPSGVQKFITKLFTEKSNGLDNHFLINLFENYNSTFSKGSLNTDSQKVYSKIVEMIRKIDKNKEAINADLFDLNFSLSQLQQASRMVDSVIIFKDFNREYKPGKDIIRDPYHHLPNLLFINDSFDSSIKDRLHAFLAVLIEVFNSDNRTLIMYANNLLEALGSKRENYWELRTILIPYINLMAENKNDFASDSSELFRYSKEDDSLISYYEKCRKIFDISRQKLVQNNKNILSTNDESLLSTEVAYILIWVYRRAGKEDEGIELALSLINKQTDNDPRIFQGLALCYVARLFKMIKAGLYDYKDIGKLIGTTSQYLKLAIDGFKHLINNSTNSHCSELLFKNLVAVLNTNANLYLQRYIVQGESDESLIVCAKSDIEEIKSLFNAEPLSKLNYFAYPTYVVTELEISYFEITIFIKNKEINKARAKILESLVRKREIEKRVELTKYIDSHFLEGIQKIEKLALQFFKQNLNL